MPNRNETLAYTRECATRGYALHLDRPDLGVQVFAMNASGRIIGKGFVGKAGKPAFHYSFTTPEKLAEYVARFVENVSMTQAHKAARRAEERAAPAPKVALGDIFRASWGYDQTNIDYYQVTRLCGNRTVEIRPIGRNSAHCNLQMAGFCTPAPGQFTGPPIIKRIKNYGGAPVIRIESFCHAYRIAPKAETGAFAPDRFTDYA